MRKISKFFFGIGVLALGISSCSDGGRTHHVGGIDPAKMNPDPNGPVVDIDENKRYKKIIVDDLTGQKSEYIHISGITLGEALQRDKRSRVQSLKDTVDKIAEAFDTKDYHSHVKISERFGSFSLWVPVSAYKNLAKQAVRSPGIATSEGSVTLRRLDDHSPISLHLGISHSVLLQPTIAQETPKPLSSDYEEMLDFIEKAHGDYNGLERMNIKAFHKAFQADIADTSIVPNGSSVKAGVLDTGIAYANPGFFQSCLDAEDYEECSKTPSRIKYLFDDTSEGKAYFDLTDAGQLLVESNLTADEISLAGDAAPEGLVAVTGKVILPQRGHNTLPHIGNKQHEQQLQRVVVNLGATNKALVNAHLLKGGSVRLGLTSEKALSEPSPNGKKLDLDGDGDNTSQFYFLVLSSKGAEDYRENHKFLFSRLDAKKDLEDKTRVLDFSESKFLTDWNLEGQNIPANMVRAGEFREELLGFVVTKEELPVHDQEGTRRPALGINFVGFDPDGHGTHVASTVASHGHIKNTQGDIVGAGGAPSANLYVSRVCAINGGCMVAPGIQTLVEQGTEVINVSIGGLGPYNDGYDVNSILYDRIADLTGTQLIISAGNSGPALNTVGSPSVGESALSVAATATPNMIKAQYNWSPFNFSPEDGDKDFVLQFSSRGPNAAGGLKPNLAAPGTQLGAAPLAENQGSDSGVTVSWGTSMAAPAATGAYVLLLDAAKKYNTKYPDAPQLPTRNTVLRRILMESARPFGKEEGTYTWKDQGYGMVDLAAAWDLLKKHAENKVQTSLTLDGKEVPLYYSARLKDTIRNQDYTGKLHDPSANQPIKQAKGIWLEAGEKQTRFRILAQRKLPEWAVELARKDESGAKIAKLYREFSTTQDTFTYEVIYEDQQKNEEGRPNWVVLSAENRMGNQNASCADLDTSRPLIMTGGSNGSIQDNWTVCVDRAKLNSFKPGDYGAIIKVYRTVNDQKSSVSSFEIPVHYTKPHGSLTGSTFTAEGTVTPFEIDRNYFMVPEGTSSLTLSLEVPDAAVNEEGGLENCSKVGLYLHEAKNKLTQTGAPRNRVSNCTMQGVIDNSKRKLSYNVEKPAAGIWEAHILGLYTFTHSQYKMGVEFITVDTKLDEITTVQGSEKVVFVKASQEVKLDVEASSFAKPSLSKETLRTISMEDGKKEFPNHADQPFFTFPDATEATIKLSGAKGHDLDLYVYSCSLVEGRPGDECEPAGQSATATSDESVTLDSATIANKAIVVKVNPYAINNKEKLTKFGLIESFIPKGVEAAPASDANLVAHPIDAEANAFTLEWNLGSKDLPFAKLMETKYFAEQGFMIESSLVLNTIPSPFTIPIRLVKNQKK